MKSLISASLAAVPLLLLAPAQLMADGLKPSFARFDSKTGVLAAKLTDAVDRSSARPQTEGRSKVEITSLDTTSSNLPLFFNQNVALNSTAYKYNQAQVNQIQSRERAQGAATYARWHTEEQMATGYGTNDFTYYADDSECGSSGGCTPAVRPGVTDALQAPPGALH